VKAELKDLVIEAVGLESGDPAGAKVRYRVAAGMAAELANAALSREERRQEPGFGPAQAEYHRWMRAALRLMSRERHLSDAPGGRCARADRGRGGRSSPGRPEGAGSRSVLCAALRTAVGKSRGRLADFLLGQGDEWASCVFDPCPELGVLERELQAGGGAS
jgi:hypothetical protein